MRDKDIEQFAQESFKKKTDAIQYLRERTITLAIIQNLVASYFSFVHFFLISSNIFYHNFKLIFMRENLRQQIFFPLFCRIWDIFIRNFLKL